MVFYSLGDSAGFEAAMAALHQSFEDGDIGMADWIAHTYTFINDTDAAFEWLERAHDEGVLDFSQNLAYYQRLHGDPRWPALLERLGRSPGDMQGLAIDVRLPG